MDQVLASTSDLSNGRAFMVAPPHDWDGIGQALRAAYRDHHATPGEIAEILHQLDEVD